MSNSTPGVDRNLYVRDVRVECSPEDGDRPELDGLKLTIINELNQDLYLAQISATTWQQKDTIEILVPVHGLVLVASSEGFGDLGYMHVDFGDFFVQNPEQDNIRTGKNLKWRIQPMEDAPGLSLSLKVRTSEVDDVADLLPEAFREDMDVFQLYSDLQILPNDFSMKSDGLNFCGHQFLRKFKMARIEGDIQAAIKAYEQANALLSADDPKFASFMEDLGLGYYERYYTFGQVADIDEAIIKCQVAVAMTLDGHDNFHGRLYNLGRLFNYRFERTGNLADITESIQLHQRAVHLILDGHSDLPVWLSNLGNLFIRRFERTEDLTDISESIQLHQHAIQLTPDGHPNLPAWLNNLGCSFQRQFDLSRKLADVTESIQLHQRAIQLTPEEHEDLPTFLSNLGDSFLCRFERSGGPKDISESIQIHRRAIQLTPDGHPYLSARLNNLGRSLLCHFQQTGELADISESIRLQQKAVHLTPNGHARLPIMLNNLGQAIHSRSERTGDFADISESIKCHQRAVELAPEGHAALPDWLRSLGGSLLSRFERTGELADILKSIQLYQRAVQLTPDGHPSLAARLNDLGNSYLYRFQCTGELADVSESIQLHQRAVHLTPDGHPDLPRRLTNLGNSFFRRYEQTRDPADISESIQLQQDAIKLTPDGHPDSPGRLNALGGSFLRRFEQTKRLTDVSESIRLRQRTIQLAPDGHPDLSTWLTNLGNSFLRRFEQTGDQTDISESIQHHQRAVRLTPADGHADLPARLSNLGGSFFYRFQRDGDLADILESIRLRQQAVQLTPDGHSNLPVCLYNLGMSFLCYFEHTQQVEYFNSAISNFRISAMFSTSYHSICIFAAKIWAFLSSRGSSPFAKSQLLDAHERIIQLLSLITGFENTLKRRHDLLLESSELSTSAAATALSINNPGKALEWLEQGRCIVWNQINQLRTPVDDLRAYNTALADQFSVLSSRLEDAGSRPDPRRTGAELSMDAKISLQSEAHSQLKLAKERDELLTTIRNTPGFENFLRPRSYANLMSGLPGDGPVIIINADKDRCDALALMAGCDEPMHIPLERFSYDRATTLAEGLRKYLTSHQLRSRYSEAAFDPRALVPSKPGSSDSLQVLLQTLWTDLVRPILQALAFKIPDDRGDLPHVWWCPTGPFAFLPIHAAGTYKDGKDIPLGTCLADFAISSYIPTISILERLRSRSNTNVTNSGVLIISQPDAPGLPMIPCTVAEGQQTREELTKRGIRSALYQSKDATVDVISKSLESFSCVHLACHASQGIKDPLESAIHLYDGPLKLSEIMKKNLLHADLAFMSACQTSAGNEKLPEEAVHLAAGMLAAGYRSVVATMWSISDQHAPQVAQTFYENLLNNSTNEGRTELDGTGAAEALHIATRRLREKLGDSTEGLLAWIPYIHYGT